MLSNFSSKIMSALRGDDAKASMSKFKASSYAILLGLFIGIIPIAMSGGSPFIAYKTMVTAPFAQISLRPTIIYMSIFILLGAGIGVSFKTGLFNIGASGQFLAGGATTIIFGILFEWNLYISIPFLLLMSMIVGALVAALAGALKAFFNVHEVVSTILINWTLFYFIKWIFKSDKLKSEASENSEFIHASMGWSRAITSNHYIIIFLLAMILVSMLWFMFKYTTFGYRLRVNGLSPTAAEYAGINTKANTIISMAISGAFAGAAGFIYYNTLERQMPSLGSSLPTFGFEAITVTLLAFSSPIGAIPAGIFYSVLRVGITSAGIAGGITKETLELILGLIVFFSALATLFVEFKPTLYIYKKIWFKKDPGAIQRMIEHKRHQETRRVEYEKELSEVADPEGRKVRLKEIHNLWTKEREEILMEFKNNKIDVVSKDVKLKTMNLKYKELISSEDLEAVKNIKSNYKAFKDTGKRSVIFDLENMFAARLSMKGGE